MKILILALITLSLLIAFPQTAYAKEETAYGFGKIEKRHFVLLDKPDGNIKASWRITSKTEITVDGEKVKPEELSGKPIKVVIISNETFDYYPALPLSIASGIVSERVSEIQITLISPEEALKK